jgi:hypothetical protein
MMVKWVGACLFNLQPRSQGFHPYNIQLASASNLTLHMQKFHNLVNKICLEQAFSSFETGSKFPADLLQVVRFYVYTIRLQRILIPDQLGYHCWFSQCCFLKAV